jgi:hypothetical protein
MNHYWKKRRRRAFPIFMRELFSEKNIKNKTFLNTEHIDIG